MERILRKSGALLVEENEEGKILFSDVEERNTAHAGRYAEYPFAAEFAYEKDGEEIHGDTDCFRLTSVGTRGKTLIKEYSSQDGAVKVTVKQIFRQGVLSQICTIKNLGAVKLCVKKLANRFAGIGGRAFRTIISGGSGSAWSAANGAARDNCIGKARKRSGSSARRDIKRVVRETFRPSLLIRRESFHPLYFSATRLRERCGRFSICPTDRIISRFL